MKNIIPFFTFLILIVNSSFTQSNDEEINELYPEKYTLEKAEGFQKKGEYNKAIWYYINLFPENKASVTYIVKKLAKELDSIDMGKFVKESFALYVTFDPSIALFDKGVLKIDKDKLELKGSWGDELIFSISDQNKPLTSASEYNLRGLDKAKFGYYYGAIEDFNKAIEIEPIKNYYFNRATIKSYLEDFHGAIQDFNKAIEHKHRLAEAYFERGYCKYQLLNDDGAIEDFTKAIENYNRFEKAYNNRAAAQMRKHNYTAAIKDTEKAIEINSSFFAPYVIRGDAKKSLGDMKGACEDWLKAVELGYEEANVMIKEYCK